MVTVIGLQVGALLGNTIITESLFALPGVGRLMIDSIFARDYPTVQGLALVFAVIVMAVNLLADFAYTLIDRRVARS